MLVGRRAAEWHTADRSLQIQAGITTLDEDYRARKTEAKRVHAPLQSGLRVVVVMMIFLQPFTSLCCHGYTARGLSSWTARREQGEGGMLGCMAPQCCCFASLPLHASTNSIWHSIKKCRHTTFSIFTSLQKKFSSWMTVQSIRSFKEMNVAAGVKPKVVKWEVSLVN